MNDNTDALDELVSRYLDADLTADAARVESDPELLARADAMRAAIEAIAAPVNVPTDDLDQRRAVALDASSTSAGITDLSSARARRIEQRNRFVAVAAAVVLLAIAFTAIQRVNLDDGDEGDFATESTDSAVDSDAAADDALEMFADDIATEETAADMAQSAAAEIGDWTEDEFGNDITPGHSGSDATTIEGASVDVLPDELAPVETAGDVISVIDKAYAGVMGIPHRSDPFDGICPEAIQLITEFQGHTTVSVESTMVQIGAADFTMLVALDAFTNAETGGRIILVHPVNDCAASSVVSPESP